MLALVFGFVGVDVEVEGNKNTMKISEEEAKLIKCCCMQWSYCWIVRAGVLIFINVICRRAPVPVFVPQLYVRVHAYPCRRRYHQALSTCPPVHPSWWFVSQLSMCWAERTSTMAPSDSMDSRSDATAKGPTQITSFIQSKWKGQGTKQLFTK